jgi:enoyl-CoA hydratase
MSPPILLQTLGAVLVITIDAPQRRNALTPEMLCRLADAFIAFARGPALRVAVLTGAGDQAFCAGGDLARTLPLMTGDRAPEDDWDRRLLDDPQVLAASGLRDFPLDKPVVAAINGTCMAAGFEMMLGNARHRHSHCRAAREVRLARGAAGLAALCWIDGPPAAPGATCRRHATAADR